MKIADQTADGLILKDGNAGVITVGGVAVLASIVIGFFSSSFGAMTIWIAVALFILGLGVILFGSSIIITASKASGRIVYQKKRLVGSSSSIYNIADILRIETRTSWRTVGSTLRGNSLQQVPVSQSIIAFKDGQELPLGHQTNSFGPFSGPAILAEGPGKEASIANQVALFFGVPFQEVAPPAESVNTNL